MATPGYAALYRVPGAQQSSVMDSAPEENIGEDKAPTMGLSNPSVPDEVRSNGQPQMMFDPSRARYAYGGMAQGQEKILDDVGYRAYEDGGMVIPELQGEGMPVDLMEDEPMMMEEEDMTMEEDMANSVDREEAENLAAGIDTTNLTSQDEEILEEAINMHPELLDIIPKMIIATDEFTGEGEVEGPGTETSDSIPARLSDGEFVFTAKSVKHLGVDKLRKMMSKAENDYDKDMNVQDEQQMESVDDIVPQDVMSAARGGLLKNPYK
tara:strand:- start:6656 stop:7456 length:801 start_codon:yes stop_codon:yes gene_type:complete